MHRREEIQSELSKYGLDAVLLTHEANCFYASGIPCSGTDATMLLTRDTCYYLTDFRYLEQARCLGAGMVILEIDEEAERISAVSEIAARHRIERMGFEEVCLSVHSFRQYEGALSCLLVPASECLGRLRAVKTEDEIRKIRSAQAIAERAFFEVLPFLKKPGATEREVAAKLTYDMLRFGAERVSFEPIVVSGPNGSLAHGRPGARAFSGGEFITMDFGCVYEGYCSDMTRTVSLGEPSDEMRLAYDTVLRAQQAGIEKVKALVPAEEVHEAAGRVIEAAGFGIYFRHGFGHGVGVEIHEEPYVSVGRRDPLLSGAVMTAEPGIYIPGRFGVRIEDMLLIREGGNENLTCVPKELLIL